MQPRIRKFEWKNIGSILRLEQECFPKAQWDELMFLEWYERCPEGFLVAESADRIIGYVICSAEGYIASIAVAAEERGKGIGSALIEHAVARLSPKMLHLHCRVGNVGAQNFFKRLGFKETGRIRSYYSDSEDAVEMVKKL